MHEAQVEGQSAEGAYLQCTATTPFETVCKQFVNGSVPFGFSLNSGFDTGNDSWFSRGCLSGRRGGAHTCPETHARRSVGGREREGRAHRSKATTSCWFWDSKKPKKKKKSLCRRKRGRRVERLESILVLTCSHCRPRGPPTGSPPQEERTSNTTLPHLSCQCC